MFQSIKLQFMKPSNSSYFDAEELRMLLCYTKDEKQNLKNCSRQSFVNGSEPVFDAAVLHDVKKCFRDNRYDCFRVDFDTFRRLFIDLTPWGHVQNIDVAEKLFRVSIAIIRLNSDFISIHN